MQKKGKKIVKIVGITLLALVLLISVGGFVAYKIFGSQVLSIILANKPGNAAEYDVSTVTPNADSPLQGKTIIFLGSSVTDGYGACGSSFVEYLEAVDGVIPVKEAVSGTTLVNNGETSYIPRMEALDKTIAADAFICQLSTNDASKGLPMGQISDSFDKADFDTTTIAGSIEYIIAYAKETWNCPVVFYTGTYFDSPEYGTMVELLLQIQEKWDIGVIDMWNDADMNNISDADRKLYMLDGKHPTRAGYLKWWLPYMESYLYEYLGV